MKEQNQGWRGRQGAVTGAAADPGGAVLCIARVINKNTHDATKRRAARRRYRCDRCENQAEGKGGEYKSKSGGWARGGRGERAGHPYVPGRASLKSGDVMAAHNGRKSM